MMTATYTNAAGITKTVDAEFRRWTRAENGDMFAVFKGVKTPLTVKESNLSPETLSLLPAKPDQQSDEPPTPAPAETFPPKPMTRELAEKLGFSVREISEHDWHLIWDTSFHYPLSLPRTSADSAWKLALDMWGWGEFIGIDHKCRRWLELHPNALDETPHPELDGSATTNAIEEQYGLRQPESVSKPEPRFKPAPEDFEPSVKDADVWAAAKRAADHISVRGMPIKRDGLFFKNRADVWARREVWPLVVWDDMTLVIWRNGRIFLCALTSAVEVDLPKSVLKKLYAIHFGGSYGA